MDLDAGEQRPIDGLVVLPVQVMVSPHLQVPGLCRIRIMEFRQELIDRRVGDVDLVEIVVLPELLGIAQLDVGEAVFEVVLQGAAVDQGVLGEVVGPGTVPPVHVGHEISFMPGVRVSRRIRSSLGRASSISSCNLLFHAAAVVTEAIDLPEGILGGPDHRPMARKDDPDAERFRQRRKGSLGLPLIPTEAIHVSPAVLPAQDQVAGDEFPGGLVVENHRLLRVARRGDHLPAAEADPGTRQAIPFEIPDPVCIGHTLADPGRKAGAPRPDRRKPDRTISGRRRNRRR